MSSPQSHRDRGGGAENVKLGRYLCFWTLADFAACTISFCEVRTLPRTRPHSRQAAQIKTQFF